jgi:hypothetical protein
MNPSKCFFLFFIFSVLFLQTSAQRKIVIIGKVANYKSGVSVVCEKTGKYYVFKKFEYWDEKMVGKKIKVWGQLKLERPQKTKYESGYPIPQNFSGIRRLIVHPKWKLLE